MLCHSTWHPLLNKIHSKNAVQPLQQCFFSDPAGPVRNISICSHPPLAFNLLIMPSTFVTVSVEPPKLCCRYLPNFVYGLCPSFTTPRRNVQAIISYAMYCFSSSFVFWSLATFHAISGRVGTFFYYDPLLYLSHGHFQSMNLLYLHHQGQYISH
jgi:hypothetical protein